MASALSRRRLALLFGLAMLHGFGLWWGEILSLYAVSSAILYGCRSWQPRRLLAMGLTLYGAMALLLVPDGSDPALAAEAAAAITQARASWAGAYRVNTASYVEMLRWYPFTMPATLGLMLVGLALFKSGLLAGRADPRCYRLLLACGGAA